MIKIFTTQVEYNKFYDELRRYVDSRARGLFSDIGLRNEAIDKALEEVENEIIGNKIIENHETFSRGVIRNSLKRSARDRKIDLAFAPISLTQEGKQALGNVTRIKRVVYKGKYPKVILTDIEDKRERRVCLDYWQYGFTTNEIARKQKLTPRRIQQIISKYAK